MNATRITTLLLAAAATLTVAACGSSTSIDPSNAATSSAQHAEAAVKFSKCMREHGVKNFPSPTVSGGHVSLQVKAGPGGIDVPPATMEAAQKACAHYQEALLPKLSPQQKIEREEQVRKFAVCMRAHGIHLETSTAGGGIAIRIKAAAGTAGPNPASPAFREAQEACGHLLPHVPGKHPPGGEGPPSGPSSQKGTGSEGTHRGPAVSNEQLAN
ncbi:MAG TPA: hypothetical protein VMA83_09440 [Solirubrobacteraceae bacterium]|nr:hypothetical protein [Solirubrobacteraceae bacterium]